MGVDFTSESGRAAVTRRWGTIKYDPEMIQGIQEARKRGVPWKVIEYQWGYSRYRLRLLISSNTRALSRGSLD